MILSEQKPFEEMVTYLEKDKVFCPAVMAALIIRHRKQAGGR
jgi:hypothetical protein